MVVCGEVEYKVVHDLRFKKFDLICQFSGSRNQNPKREPPRYPITPSLNLHYVCPALPRLRACVRRSILLRPARRGGQGPENHTQGLLRYQAWRQGHGSQYVRA